MFELSPEEAAAAAAAGAREIRNGGTRIDFDHYFIGNEGIKEVAAALETSTSLLVLKLGPEGAKVLAAALKTNKSLQTLVLKSNYVRDQGAKALAAALKDHWSLQRLYLDDIAVGDEGIIELAAALKTNWSLQTLHLSQNQIRDEGAKELAAALKINTSLTLLNLRSNEIGVEGAKELATALQTNRSLQSLDLSENHVADPAVLSEIEAALKRNEANPPPSDDVKWLEAVRDAITNGNEHAWGRTKLMVVGRGAAGKTATVRSLHGLAPARKYVPTVMADIHRTNAERWTPLDSGRGEFDAQVRYAAAQRLQSVPGPPRQSLPRRISAAFRASLRRFSRASSSAAAPGSLEPASRAALFPLEDVAKTFAMRPEDHALFRQAVPMQARVSFTIWDFGGEGVLHALHHVFLSDRGVYLVVFDMREIVGKERFKRKLAEEEYDKLSFQDEAIASLRLWLNTIKLHAPDAPVLMVGTFENQVHHQLREVDLVLREKLAAGLFENLVEPPGGSLFFTVNNCSRDPSRAAELRSALAATAAKLHDAREKIPLAWLKLYVELLSSGAPYMLYEQVVEMGAEHERSRRDVGEMVRFFHERGVVVHLRDCPALERVVVIAPQWLLDKLARLVADDLLASRKLRAAGFLSAYERMRTDAIASRSLLQWLWADEDAVDYLVQLMDARMLLCPWRFDAQATEDEFLIAGLLSDSAHQEVDTGDFTPGLSCELDFSASFLPDGVFYCLMAQCAAYATRPEVVAAGGDEPMPPELASMQASVSFGVNSFLVAVEGDVVRICIAQEAERPATVIKLLVSMLREQRDTVFRGLRWAFRLVSPNSGVAVTYTEIEEARKAGNLQVRLCDQHQKRAAVSEFDRFFVEQVGPLDTDEDGPDVAAFPVRPLAPGEETHVFLSYANDTGSELAASLRLKLANRGLKVWFDQSPRNEEAMLDGVRRAHACILLLTAGVFSSASVQAELGCAIDADKPIVIVHEFDAHRRSYEPFGDYIASAPSFFADLLLESESLAVQRKWYEEDSFLRELVRRCFITMM